MKKGRLIVFLTSVLVIASVVLTTFIVEDLNNYRQKKESISKVLNFKERIMTSSEWIPFNDVASDKILEHNNLEHAAEKFYNSSVYYSIILACVIIIYSLAIGYLYWRKHEFNQMFGIALIFSSLCLIYVALQAPFLEIEAYSTDLTFKIPVDIGFWEHTFEKTFDGKTSYFYQNKSVFQLINLFFTGGNVIVGIALILFSVVFPLFKLCSSLFVLIWPKHKYSGGFRTFILLIGKWSMADVFVAGIFLAYFSFSNMNVGVETNSETLIGLYFFLAFVILSIGSSYFVKKANF